MRNGRVRGLTIADPSKVWTVRELAHASAIGGPSLLLVGSPEQIADELQALARGTGVDGFNFSYAVTPDSFGDLLDLVIPELQRRGAFKQDYARVHCVKSCSNGADPIYQRGIRRLRIAATWQNQ
jgi:alkanesulfonate monooxygenase SsuD/methylene tetrahydromethanopterin reductase-like flavin-dependent oxidoreductase (luciferase family)